MKIIIRQPEVHIQEYEVVTDLTVEEMEKELRETFGYSTSRMSETEIIKTFGLEIHLKDESVSIEGEFSYSHQLNVNTGDVAIRRV